jgi:hypothetical protein
VSGDRNTMAFVHEARLGTYVISDDGRSVGGAPQKALLWAIWMEEGNKVTFERLNRLVGCSQTTCWRAMRALIDRGVVVEHHWANQRAAWYTLDRRTLKKLGSSRRQPVGIDQKPPTDPTVEVALTEEVAAA